VNRRTVIALVVLCAGCSAGSQRNEDFVPAEDTARVALEAYLRAWAQGVSAQPVPGTRPAVFAADELRAGGRPLTEFTVLGPVPADAPRCLAVRLTLGKPRQVVRERYIIVGIDPIWVIRHEDYQMVTHWDHAMPPDTKAPAKAR
jgi:hypothetical protein